MSTLTVTLVQTDIQWLSPEANFTHIERLLENVEPSDLILLPETFATGFAVKELDVERYADAAIEFLQQCAQRFGAVVAGSILVPQGDKKANRMVWCQPDGKILHYDKRHLFCLGNEGDFVVAGEHREVFELKGIRFLPQICYDLRFPVFQRNQTDYEVMVNIANWPAARRNHWDTLLAARAIENQCFVLAVNRVGEDGYGTAHNGGTKAIDFNGNSIVSAADDQAEVITVKLKLSDLQQYKAKFPAHLDADKFTLA
ncbi:amidohydrolase [Pseudoalteromonas sp. JC3]|uniref:amidohydrolase n=1 Tax=Pseudoalteromonas sp. JC3 TaxID=2810196 RepID=UPI0019D1EA32|nr:amidohydrolase [Pseudoalteromonas sp. JC3]MBR8841918.1 amidohydrolase [Pseudoalteromonas sp. JC3]WJE08680.1 amidohydrolase [Pseudoalteromonas sp. JC3]